MKSYNGQICNTNEGTTFVSNNTKTFMVNKVITFTQLLELVHQKLNIEPQQHIQHLHFRCPIFESGQRYMYTSFILWDDADVRQIFNIFYNIFSNFQFTHFYCSRWHGNITVEIHNILQFTLHYFKKLNVSPAKLT